MVTQIIIFLEMSLSVPFSFSIALHFVPALDPLPVSEDLEVMF